MTKINVRLRRKAGTGMAIAIFCGRLVVLQLLKTECSVIDLGTAIRGGMDHGVRSTL
jgi:hypothetical protein